MRTLRFLCFASLAVLIICLAGGGYIGLADEADPVGMATPRQEEPCKVPLAPGPVDETADPGGSAGVNSTSKPPTSSGTIMITMTGVVGGPGDLGQGK